MVHVRGTRTGVSLYLLATQQAQSMRSDAQRTVMEEMQARKVSNSAVSYANAIANSVLRRTQPTYKAR